ncbi:cyclin-dependent kinase 2 isoform X2 [Strix uralensis]|uniref:cyclin-dependent kinase 2 isoform X2 n=1 Tax=Strix uralensis TaxID=36305 RepID=UPI003DA76572
MGGALLEGRGRGGCGEPPVAVGAPLRRLWAPRGRGGGRGRSGGGSRRCPPPPQAAGRDPHGEQALPGVRVPAPGPEEVHGLVVHQRHRPPPHQELLVPAAAGPGLLPRAPRAAPRPQAPEPAHQRRRRHQIGRFRPGPRLRGARAHLHPRGGDTLVPSPRDPAGLQVLLDGRRHLELGLHLRRDDHPARSVPRGLGDRPALPHLPHAGDAGRGGLARGHGHARLQAQLPQVGPAGLRQSGAAPGRGGTEAAGANAALRPQQADLGQGGAGTPLLPRCHQGCPPPAAVRGRGPPLRAPPSPCLPSWVSPGSCLQPSAGLEQAGGGLPPVPPSRKEPPSLH